MNTEQDLRIGIYGGTFAPPHMGHVKAARAFMEQMKLDYLYVIPAYLPPHKQVEKDDDPHHRLKMCELAFGGLDGVVVSDMEIRRGGKSYTFDTLNELRGEGKRLFLLCGTDMVLSFDTWYRYEEILRMCYPVYMRRENDPILEGRLVAKITEYYQKHGVMFRRILGEALPVSSTQIRRAAASGEDLSGMVCPEVAQYIKEKGLYV